MTISPNTISLAEAARQTSLAEAARQTSLAEAVRQPRLAEAVAQTSSVLRRGLYLASTLILLSGLGACAIQKCDKAAPDAIVPASYATATDQSTSAHDNLNAVLFQQTAAEYQASTLQAFAQAQSALLLNLKDKSLTAASEQSGNFQALPPAVIVDVDETMLDNSAYMARLLKEDALFNDSSWNKWCEEQKALEVPGAKAFSEFARAQGVRVIYLSNRDISTTESTRLNLAKLGFADASSTENFAFRDKAAGLDSKGARRALLAKKYRIVMLIGDNLGDFTEAYRTTRAERSALITAKAQYFGSRWIMIPNPTYGSWEQTLSNFDRALSPEQVRKLKHDALRLQLD